MSLRQLINDQVENALSLGGPLGDIPKTITYKSAQRPNAVAYDPLLQTTTRTDVPAAGVTIDVVEIDFSKRELETADIRRTQLGGINILPQDKKWLISRQKLTKLLVTLDPKPNDIGEDGGVTWVVKDVKSDPTGALWILQVRPSGR